MCYIPGNMKEVVQLPNAAWGRFLGDVFICSLGAYGGPEAHLGVFTEQMVVRRKYLDESELIELVALCSMLPGPTSTQTIVSIGYRTGGPVLALLTMLVWALPVLTVMTILSFLYQFLAGRGISADGLRYVGPMAVGFIILAAFRIGRKVVKDRSTALLMVFGAVTTYLIRAPWIFPLVLIIGGAVAILTEREKNLWNRVRIKPPWRYLIVFALLALGGLTLEGVTHHRLVHVFENFYRYGYLVFGGGQVVVPVMHSELVQVRGYMTNQEFMTGYGLVQGLPGPMFSFAAYAGGLAARGGSGAFQVLGAVLGGIGIFLPGLLLIYFVYPVWESLKRIRAVRVSLRGVNAVAGGLIAIAAVILMQAGGPRLDNLLVTVVTVALLATRKVPAPLIVAAALAAGFVSPF
ncbi:MAG: chromate efflux transporter [Lentisphaeria bacterium]|nr:chromate efflux transporter [Lentisphaeria bacterium]